MENAYCVTIEADKYSTGFLNDVRDNVLFVDAVCSGMRGLQMLATNRTASSGVVILLEGAKEPRCRQRTSCAFAAVSTPAIGHDPRGGRCCV